MLARGRPRAGVAAARGRAGALALTLGADLKQRPTLVSRRRCGTAAVSPFSSRLTFWGCALPDWRRTLASPSDGFNRGRRRFIMHRSAIRSPGPGPLAPHLKSRAGPGGGRHHRHSTDSDT